MKKIEIALLILALIFTIVFILKMVKGEIKDLDVLFKDKGQYSLKKVMYFFTLLATIYIHVTDVNEKNAVTVLMIDYLFILLMLGIITAQQALAFKNNQPIPPASVVTNTVEVKTETKT